MKQQRCYGYGIKTTTADVNNDSKLAGLTLIMLAATLLMLCVSCQVNAADWQIKTRAQGVVVGCNVNYITVEAQEQLFTVYPTLEQLQSDGYTSCYYEVGSKVDLLQAVYHYWTCPDIRTYNFKTT